MHNTRHRITAVVGGLSLALALAACMPSDNTDAGSGATADASVAPGCEDYAQYGDLSGKTVSVYTSIVEPESVDQEDSYAKFEECTCLLYTSDAADDLLCVDL